MKKILIIIVFAILFKPIFPVAEYMINYDYISKVLCENKAKPQLKCNGKCQLSKKILAAEKEQQKAAQKGSYQFNISIEILCNTVFIPSINTLEITINPIKFQYGIKDELAGHYSTIFHPPQLA